MKEKDSMKTTVLFISNVKSHKNQTANPNPCLAVPDIVLHCIMGWSRSDSF